MLPVELFISYELLWEVPGLTSLRPFADVPLFIPLFITYSILFCLKANTILLFF